MRPRCGGPVALSGLWRVRVGTVPSIVCRVLGAVVHFPFLNCYSPAKPATSGAIVLPFRTEAGRRVALMARAEPERLEL